jgi:FkbM family methyltransferase
VKLLEWYYRKCGAGDLYKISERYSFEVSWIIEAGCHDGMDTLELIKHFSAAQVYAFEPDPKAREKAESRFKEIRSNTIQLFPYGLSDQQDSQFLNYVNDEKGTGTTSISTKGSESVELIALDEFVSLPVKSGLLWLDVEGHAVKALKGMEQTLKGIDLAKIEIQMHQKSEQRPQDFEEVIKIMNHAGLIPIYGPIHPGYFGDIYFARSQSISFNGKIKSFLIRLQMWLLHKHIYPLLNKPKE